MQRTRLTAATLAVAMSVSTIHVVAPDALAQTVQTRTVSEVDQQAYADALGEWQRDRDAASGAVSEAERTLGQANQRVADAEEAAGKARADVDTARANAAAAKAALDAIDVEGKQRAADAASSQLRDAEAKLGTAQKRVDDARATRDSAQAEFNDLDKQLQEKKDALSKAEDGLRKSVAIGEEVKAERAKFDERVRTGSDYSVEDWERLTGQAVAEMINDYRVANGLHPLVTHEIYIQQAQAWSDQMVADIPRLGTWVGAKKGDETAFRHSEAADYGRSGENIAGHFLGAPTATATREQWKTLPEKLFTGWHNSPGHNKNMLSPNYEGMGLGITVEPDGTVWATTMFFHDQVNLNTRSYFPADASTQRAKRSGSPFYLPAGAREAMQTPAMRDNLRDTKGVTPSYANIASDVRGFSRNAQQGMDPKITKVDYDADRKEIENAEKLAAGLIVIYLAGVDGARKNADEVSAKTDSAAARSKQAQLDLDRVSASRDAARKDRDAAAAAKTDADATLDKAQRTPKQPLIDAVTATTQNLSDQQKRASSADAALAEARKAADDASTAAAAKRAALQTLDASRPRERDFVVEREVTETLPAPTPAPTSTSTPAPSPSPAVHSGTDSTPTSKGSSTGAIIGIVIAVLAVIGVAVAWPEISKHLPQ